MELVPSFCFEVMSANIHQIVRKKQGSTKSPPCFLSLLVLFRKRAREKLTIKNMEDNVMANLSDAHGIFTVKARTKEIGNKVMDIIFKTQEAWEYNMIEIENSRTYFKSDENIEIATSFFGTGSLPIDIK